MSLATADAQWTADGVKAQAGQVESDAISRADYTLSKAVADSFYQKEMAAADYQYVLQVAPARAAAYLAGDTAEAMVAFNSVQSSADLARSQSRAEATTDRAERIGDAQITLAGRLGDALITLATAEGAAAQQYHTSANAANATYCSIVSEASIAYVSSTAAANMHWSNDLAAAEKTLSCSLADTAAAFAEQLGDEMVARAVGIAEATADYQIGVATANTAALTARWTATNAESDHFEAAAAQAQQTWYQSNRDDYVAYVRAAVQAQADYAHSEAIAQANRTKTETQATVQYVSDTGELLAAVAVKRETAIQNHAQTTDALTGQWWTVLSQADGTHGVADATAEKARAVAMAAARKELELGRLSGTIDCEQQYQTALADAEIAYVTGIANADLTWTRTTAGADKQYCVAYAAQNKLLTTNVAEYAREADVGLAEKAAVRARASVTASIAYAGDVQTAIGKRNTDLASAGSAFLAAGLADQKTGLQGVVQVTDIPWTRYLLDRAITLDSWWDSQKVDFLQLAEDQNTLAAASQKQLAEKLQTLGETSTQADLTYATAFAGSHEVRMDDAANATYAYQQQVAVLSDTYLVETAQAERDRRINQALVSAGRAESDDTANHDRLNAVRKTYSKSEAFASAIQRVALATADWSDVSRQSIAGVAYVRATATASRGYRIAEAKTTAAATGKQIDLAADYAKRAAASRAAAFAELATENGTPWATRDSQEAAAQSDYIRDTWAALVQKVKSAAASQRDQQISTAQAEADNAIQTAQSAVVTALAAATGSLLLETSHAAADIALAALDLYNPELPSLYVDLPETESVHLDAITSGDYAAPAPFGATDAAITGMFARNYHSWPGFSTPSSRLVGYQLQGGLLRDKPNEVSVEVCSPQPAAPFLSWQELQKNLFQQVLLPATLWGSENAIRAALLLSFGETAFCELVPGEIDKSYRAIFGENEPLYLMFRKRGGTITTEDYWSDHSRSWVYSDDALHRRYQIYIDKDLDDLTAAYYLHLELLSILVEDADVNSEFVNSTPDGPERQAITSGQRYKEIQEAMRRITAVGEILVSIANEGADLALTIHELSEGNVYAVIGFLPFIPAGAGRVLLRHGDEVIKIEAETLQMLRRAHAEGKLDEAIDFLRRSGKLTAKVLDPEHYKWKKHLESFGRDALGAKYPGGSWPGTEYVTHAHHIVLKEGLGVAGKRAAAESRELLEKYGIDPLLGPENLIWAPNWGHADRYAEDVLNALKQAERGGGAREVIRRRLVETLKRLGQDYNAGRWRPRQ